ALWAVAWLLVDGTGAWLDADTCVRGLRRRGRDPRRRRVLPRTRASSARRRHRPAAPARPLLRSPLALVGARRDRRSRGRRLRPGGSAVRALARRRRGVRRVVSRGARP